MAQSQPWITNNKPFSNIVEEKLKYFVHDEDNYIITNFDMIFQRVKGLIENYHVNTHKLEKIFTRSITKRKMWAKQKNQEKESRNSTAKEKTHSISMETEKRKNQKKNQTGIRKLTRLKYQAIRYQIEAADEVYYMKEVFRKRPSRQHGA